MTVAAELDKALRPLVRGELPVHLTAWDGSTAGPSTAPRVVLRSPDALRRLLWSPGELGAAQAYVTGEIDVEGDLGEALAHVWAVARERGLTGVRPSPAMIAKVLRVAAKLGVVGGPLPAPATQANIRGRLHSLLRDRAAISHHYDLSNDFYALVLDPQMAYSCAYFTRNAPGAPEDSDYGLEDAQRDKLDLVCRKIGLEPGLRLLDVGCGWGSLSLHAAAEYGAHVVGVTISREQKAFIDARIAERGLQDRVEIRLQDYREVPDGPFDAVASLEMGEHVGEKNYARYAQALYDNAKPGARVLIQQMSRTGRHPGGGPFIESFIAPDMTMRPVGESVAYLERAGLEVRDVHGLREHYVWTVDAWREKFESRWDDVVAMVGLETARVWRLYLVGGGMSFAQGRMGVDQILSVKPTAAGQSLMPAVRVGSARSGVPR
ncbi:MULTISPECIES: class I SAM-dependent methyltransferase [unclassified Rhodococcus (in: high G+C Gram-positive bacteria)]|uniref:class I SAM-dependent methyltransferase n=1 Tax=unclassified Rhodococcus (in: high G+C Gram-positive bacteria) TaxID=192944 RepID=UPI00163A9E37|nr:MULTISPECIES: class I SAM-dependent methyltransferase [unclassified Rhodococcus (in: high G+C Gram-positive bacteria)]MBC2640119.1 class I SAM-dependent methyltransferase [Rhodococcus sp. 3A]MBC2895135.1 class I SAM-dependent methyltransferase [Rhodococcus sp. 4CII]